MKLPGKRDRLRGEDPSPASGPDAPNLADSLAGRGTETSLPSPPEAKGSSPKAAAPGAYEPSASEPRGAGLLAGALLALPVLGVLLAVSMPRPRSVPPTPEVSLVPLGTLPDVPASPAKPAETFPGSGIRAEDAGGPVPPPEPVNSGNGFLAYQEALEALPTPSLRTKRRLDQLARDPLAELDEEAARYVRDCAPALALLQKAATSSSFSRVGAPTDGDLLAPRQLGLVAIARGRMELLGGAPAMAVRWPLFVIRLGHGLAQVSPFMEAQVALRLAQTATSWIESSLSVRPWSQAERAWLADRLAALEGARPKEAPVAEAKGPPQDKQAHALDAHKRLFEAEGAALAALLQRVAKKDTETTATARQAVEVRDGRRGGGE